MAVILVKDKYYLRSLHEEIGLFDRKIAHLAKYDSFASDKERDLAAAKLQAQRDLLVRNARQLIESGISYKACEIPRSLRTEDEQASAAAAVAAKPAPDAAQVPAEARTSDPAFDGKFLNLRAEIEAYVEKRGRTGQATRTASKRG